jgi:hypothetical protein
MHRSNSTTGYLYAIRKLALHWQEHGLANGHPCEGVLDELAKLGIEDDGWRDDARCLLVAAEALVEIADDRSGEERNNHGEIVCALAWEDAHELLDEVDDDG